MIPLQSRGILFVGINTEICTGINTYKSFEYLGRNSHCAEKGFNAILSA